MAMNKKLKVNLLPGWEDITHENPEGPPTFVRSVEDATGVLQISIQSIFESGPEPNPTYADLIRLCEHVASLQEANIIGRYSGDCDLGTFGSAIATSADLPHMQIWTLSNGRDFVLATYLCPEESDPAEAAEAETIVKRVKLET
jgi:hypothetical protein